VANPSLPYVLPFVVFLALLSLDGKIGLSPEIEYPLRVVILAAVLWFFSRPVIDLKVTNWAGSIGLGVAVFVIWIGPDLISPTYRQSWLFNNSIIGSAPVPDGGYAGLGTMALAFRTIRAVILVPIIEELFWRAWLMRWLIKPEFRGIPMGTYAAQAFWITAILFALEHGSFWDVGLITGILYNWWMIRTKSLGDLILTHAVTNGVLSAYVMLAGKWQYW